MNGFRAANGEGDPEDKKQYLVKCYPRSHLKHILLKIHFIFLMKTIVPGHDDSDLAPGTTGTSLQFFVAKD